MSPTAAPVLTRNLLARQRRRVSGCSLPGLCARLRCALPPVTSARREPGYCVLTLLVVGLLLICKYLDRMHCLCAQKILWRMAKNKKKKTKKLKTKDKELGKMYPHMNKECVMTLFMTRPETIALGSGETEPNAIFACQSHFLLAILVRKC